MNLVTANEVKKYGVAVIEKQIKQGPVRVFKHNRPLFVVLSEEEYQKLTCKRKASGLFSMLQKKVSGKRSKEEIDLQLQHDREEWS